MNAMTLLDRLIRSDAPRSAALIRLMVGGVFLSEGIQKFLEPTLQGAGRFARIGIPWPEATGPFVGVVEIVCGTLILAGLLTRLAAIPLIIDMAVAIVATKIPILLGQGFWGFSLRELSSYGFWSMAHEARTDFAMLLGSIFLLIVGAGPWSLDGRMVKKKRP
jgi:putative oxidoreductase